MAGHLVVTGANVASTGRSGGTFTPTSGTWNFENSGDDDIDYTIAVNVGWLDLDTTSGTLIPSGSDSVEAELNSDADDLVPGTYVGTLTFTNTTNGSGNTTKTFTLTVTQASRNDAPWLVWYLLDADATINSLCTGGIHIGFSPQGKARPYIMVTQISRQQISSLTAPSNLATKYVQVDVVADDYDTMQRIANLVRIEIDGHSGTVDDQSVPYITLTDETDLPEDTRDGSDVRIFRRSMDFLVQHRETTS